MILVLLRLLSRWRHHWRAVLLAFTLAVASVVAHSLKPLALRFAVDKGIVASDDDKLLLGCIVLVVLFAARGVFAFGQAYMSEYLSQKVAYDLRNDLYNRIQSLSFSFHDRAQTGQLMSRVTVDVETSRQFLSSSLLNLVITFGSFFFVALIAITLSWQLTLCAAIALPFMVWISSSTAKKLRPIWAAVQREEGAYSAVLQETISGMRVVQAFSAEDQAYQTFQKANWSVREYSLEASRIAAFRQPMLVFSMNLLLIAMLGYGGHLVIGGEMTLGTLLAFTAYNSQLTSPIRQLGFLLSASSRAFAAGDRIFEVLDTDSEIGDRLGASELTNVKGHVRYQGVSFGYGRNLQVLSDINIDALPGQTVALVGPVGSGKSTVLNLLPRFYDVTEGRVTIDGIDVRDVTLDSLRANVGVVMQDVFLFNGTIRDNISYGKPDATDEEIMEAAKIAHLHDFVMTLPDGYHTWVGERGVTLSGGQKQRTAIARTLLVDPRILVLDDSTSSVDMETEYQIQQALSSLLKGRTAFVIAQRLATVLSADQILVLEDGRIVQRGAHADLVDQDGPYREIYDAQLREQEESVRKNGASATRPAVSEPGS